MKKTQYGIYTYNSPSFIRRITHKLRLKKSFKTLVLNDNDRILDYGAGDGFFASLLHNASSFEVTCYEPMKEQYDQMLYLLSNLPKIHKVENIDELSNRTFTKIFCLEVLEHLPDKELKTSLKKIYDLLDKNGKALLTVPCESGTNGFIKNSIKKLVDKNSAFTFKELLEIAFDKKKITRVVSHSDTTPYIYKHFGFNNRIFENLLIEHKFKIDKKTNFPLKFLPIFSSQIFYVVSKQ